MARIVLEPATLEFGLHTDRYDILVAELTAAGHTVTLEEPDEERAGPGIEFAYDLTVRIVEPGEDVAIDAFVIEAARRFLGAARRKRRRGQIRGPDNEPRSDFDLSDPPTDQ